MGKSILIEKSFLKFLYDVNHNDHDKRLFNKLRKLRMILHACRTKCIPINQGHGFRNDLYHMEFWLEVLALFPCYCLLDSYIVRYKVDINIIDWYNKRYASQKSSSFNFLSRARAPGSHSCRPSRKSFKLFNLRTYR